MVHPLRDLAAGAKVSLRAALPLPRLLLLGASFTSSAPDL